MMNGHLDWCIRENYLELLEDLRKGKIELSEFCVDFEEIGNLTSDIIRSFESNFIILSPNEKSLGFSDLLEEIFDLCEQYFEDLEFGYNNSPSEIELKNLEVEIKNSIEKIYFQIQNYLNETG
jgi:GTP-sensing pleiotropic transcriptional regulator CodY